MLVLFKHIHSLIYLKGFPPTPTSASGQTYTFENTPRKFYGVQAGKSCLSSFLKDLEAQPCLVEVSPRVNSLKDILVS